MTRALATGDLPRPVYHGYSRYFRGPWCMAPGCQDGASEFGIACDWHWYLLTEETQLAIRTHLLERHPRGGGAKVYGEQIFTIRFHGHAEAEWRKAQAEGSDDE